jgi:hypothetical protein
MMGAPKMRRFLINIAAENLPTESYDLLGSVEGDAKLEAENFYMKAHNVPLIGGVQLRTIVKEINA